MPSVAFVAGKSGGHIIPALTCARRIKDTSPSADLVFFSCNEKLDKGLIDADPVVDYHYTFSCGARSRWFMLPFDIVSIIYAIIKSIILLKKHDVKEVFSMGGMISIPVCLAAKILRIPTTVYEFNAVPGKAVLFLSRFATTVKVCFDSAKSYIKRPVQKVPYPLRFSQLSKLSKNNARKKLSLPSSARILLVLGGSQGSYFLNSFAESYLRLHGKNSHIYVLHQVGNGDVEYYKSMYQKMGIPHRVFSFESDLAPYYASADATIARAGAGTLFELLYFSGKALIIPLETASTTHQYDNAHALAREYPMLFTVARQSKVKTSAHDVFRVLDSLLFD